MKTKVTFLFFMAISKFILAQPTIYKTWIGEKYESYYFTKKEATLPFVHGKYNISYVDSVLLLIGKEHSDTIQFKVSKITNDSLTIVPLNTKSKGITNFKNNYTLYAEAAFDKNNFNFQKIYFSGTPCYGSCPELKLQIDSVGHMLFLGKYRTGEYEGLYQGQLSIKQLNKLKSLIKKSRLDKLPAWLGYDMDASTYDFKFYYNNVVKTSHGSFVPKYAIDLHDFLLTIYLEVKLTKIDGKEDF